MSSFLLAFLPMQSKFAILVVIKACPIKNEKIWMLTVICPYSLSLNLFDIHPDNILIDIFYLKQSIQIVQLNIRIRSVLILFSW